MFGDCLRSQHMTDLSQGALALTTIFFADTVMVNVEVAAPAKLTLQPMPAVMLLQVAITRSLVALSQS